MSIDRVISNNGKSPLCAHGPALLFERISAKNKSSRQFFTCAASRDREFCNFFMWKEDFYRKVKKGSLATDAITRENIDWSDLQQRLKRVKQLPEDGGKCFCNTCCKILCEDEISETIAAAGPHRDHNVFMNVTDDKLSNPTTLIQLRTDSKNLAQYMFADKTIDFFLSTLTLLKFTKVICLGTPRLHEQILSRKKYGIKLDSFLLDIDERFKQFYSPRHFAQYNIFNNYFFDDKGNQENIKARKNFFEFAAKGFANSNLVIVMDPPFGGLLELIFNSLNKLIANIQNTREKMESLISDISDDVSERQQDKHSPKDSKMINIPILWCFPYFMENKFKDICQNLKLLDYKVEYKNHSLYKTGSRITQSSNKGSPIRIFTNIERKKIVLPENEGYRFCKKCQRYVFPENKHCDQCEECTSRDGSQYHHCFSCSRCVKKSWVHCKVCGRCALPEHVCSSVSNDNETSGVINDGNRIQIKCFTCGSLNHLKRNCDSTGNADNKNKKQKRKFLRKTFNVGTDKKRKLQG